ncbi:arylsulfatase B-like [Dermacentor silvarum]|uniref:arylsulfatase B-like n=1 Tax=Dermacentor silvarum TaxID=543639 RepID=UPI00189B3CEF|nr:arylsulfatase B-like [Dermacentor silvarum]
MESAKQLLCVLACVVWFSSPAECAARPNIIVVVADDLGWGDVSFHGSEQIHTPNIDALAADGIVLDSYYVSPMCTPSRATLLSGRHPIHTGLQHNVIYSAMPYAFPLQFKLMPDYLKTLGYEAHAVGKWHLGHMTRNHTPTRRGFDSFYGYYSGHHGYTDHSAFEEYMDDPKEQWTGWGLDLWDNLEADRSKSGNYTTELFTQKAVEILKNRDRSKPLFLYLSHLAVHVGNFYALFEAPDRYIEMNRHIKNHKRRHFAAMLSALDDAIGQLVEALNATDAIQNTIIALTTDNGAATGGIDNSAGSNWPLRGTKMTHWEGGVRGTAFLWSPLIRQSRVSRQLMHVSDWLPTLYSAAGGNVEDLGDIDGVDMWRSLITGAGSPRAEVLHNIDPLWNMSALRVGRYKYVNGTYGGGNYDGWYHPLQVSDSQLGLYRVDNTSGDKYGLHHLYDDHGRDLTTPVDNVMTWLYEPNTNPVPSSGAGGRSNVLDPTCAAARTILSIGRTLPKHSPREVLTECGQPRRKECKPLEKPCLFDIDQDPCEINNIAEENPHVLRSLENRLEQHRKTMVPPLNKPPTRRADPRYFDFTWAPYMDSV